MILSIMEEAELKIIKQVSMFTVIEGEKYPKKRVKEVRYGLMGVFQA